MRQVVPREGAAVQRAECKELPEPRKERRGGVFLLWSERRQMEQGIAWAGPRGPFSQLEKLGKQAEEPYTRRVY